MLAEASVWISVAHVLSVFTISKHRDENGNIVEPSVAQTSGTIRSVGLRLSLSLNVDMLTPHACSL